MKTLPIYFLTLMVLIPELASAAGFQTFQAADVVLGQLDFNTYDTVKPLANRFGSPRGIAVDPTTGKIFISDNSNNRILRFSSAATAQIAGFPEAVIGQTNFSSRSPNQDPTYSNLPPNQKTLYAPQGITVDFQGRLWVCDPGNDRVLCWFGASHVGNNAPADKVLGHSSFQAPGGYLPLLTAEIMYGPGALFVDNLHDRLWVVDGDAVANRVLRFDNVTLINNGATPTQVLGQSDFTSSQKPDPPNAASMYLPGGICGDTADRLWITDTRNNRILRFDNVSTKGNGAPADGVIGQVQFFTKTEGQSAGQLSSPGGISLDSEGALWVADGDNSRVLRFSAAASLQNGAAAHLVLGQSDINVVDGVGNPSAQKLGYPSSICFDTSGKLFIADAIFNRVLRFSSATQSTTVPQLLIKIKGKKKITTTKTKLIIKGTAISVGGQLLRVEVKFGKKYKSAKGAASWKYTAKLKVGTNKILARAVDVSGHYSIPVKLTVIRK